MRRSISLTLAAVLFASTSLAQEVREVRVGDRVRATLSSRIVRERPAGEVLSIDSRSMTLRELDGEVREIRSDEIQRIELSHETRRMTPHGAFYGAVAAIPAAALLAFAAPADSDGVVIVLGGLVVVGGALIGQVLLSSEEEVWVEAQWPSGPAGSEDAPR